MTRLLPPSSLLPPIELPSPASARPGAAHRLPSTCLVVEGHAQPSAAGGRCRSHPRCEYLPRPAAAAPTARPPVQHGGACSTAPVARGADRAVRTYRAPAWGRILDGPTPGAGAPRLDAAARRPARGALLRLVFAGPASHPAHPPAMPASVCCTDTKPPWRRWPERMAPRAPMRCLGAAAASWTSSPLKGHLNIGAGVDALMKLAAAGRAGGALDDAGCRSDGGVRLPYVIRVPRSWMATNRRPASGAAGRARTMQWASAGGAGAGAFEFRCRGWSRSAREVGAMLRGQTSLPSGTPRAGGPAAAPETENIMNRARCRA